jgi:hypothetical protein
MNDIWTDQSINIYNSFAQVVMTSSFDRMEMTTSSFNYIDGLLLSHFSILSLEL